MNFLKRANAWFWGRVVNSTQVDCESLCVFRWVIGLYLLLFVAPDFSWIGQAPQAFYDPPALSLSFLVDDFPPAEFFVVVSVLCVATLCCMTIGLATRLSTAALVICDLVGKSFAYSFGKIDHSIMLTALLVCMCFTDWGARYSIDAWLSKGAASKNRLPHRADRGLALFAVALAFGFLTAGLEKAPVWLDLNTGTSGFLSWFYQGYVNLGRDHLLAPLVPRIPYWAFELGDYAAVLLECSGFAALLVSRRWWITWLLTIALFHLANLFLLNIPFTLHAGLYLAFVDWHRLVQRRPFVSLATHAGAVKRGVIVGTLGLGAYRTVEILRGEAPLLEEITRVSPVELDLWVALCLWPIVAVVLWFERRATDGDLPE